MAFVLGLDQVYQSTLLSSIPWVSHGFGTAQASPVHGTVHASLRQTHSDQVRFIEHPGEKQDDGDALITQTNGLWISIRTADCLPILLIDPLNRAVAAIHTGWRGTAARIVQLAVDGMSQRFGSDPVSLLAAIGPGIDYCCFEVGDDVTCHFEAFTTTGSQGKAHVNLKAANLHLLLDSGLPQANVDVSPHCTVSSSGFHSFRRDRTEGRMVSAVQISC